VRVLDVGCGANLIYPLLGAALCGWRFVGSDVTDAALDWAGRNAAASPHLAPLIELRRVDADSPHGAALRLPLPHSQGRRRAAPCGESACSTVSRGRCRHSTAVLHATRRSTCAHVSNASSSSLLLTLLPFLRLFDAPLCSSVTEVWPPPVIDG